MKLHLDTTDWDAPHKPVLRKTFALWLWLVIVPALVIIGGVAYLGWQIAQNY